MKKILHKKESMHLSKELKKEVQQSNLHPEDLISRMDRFLKRYPHSAEAWMVKTQMYQALGKTTLALKCLKQVEKLNSWHPGIASERAEIALSRGDLDHAVEYLERGILNLFHEFESCTRLFRLSELREMKSLSSNLSEALYDFLMFDEMIPDRRKRLRQSIDKICKAYLKKDPEQRATKRKKRRSGKS